MHPQAPSFAASPADRRLELLARHLEPLLTAANPHDCNRTVSASPTSGFSVPDSVFNHVVRAPEDPILGVLLSLSLALFHNRENYTVIVNYADHMLRLDSIFEDKSSLTG